jgi:hypothetical protein
MGREVTAVARILGTLRIGGFPRHEMARKFRVRGRVADLQVRDENVIRVIEDHEFLI